MVQAGLQAGIKVCLYIGILGRCNQIWEVLLAQHGVLCLSTFIDLINPELLCPQHFALFLAGTDRRFSFGGGPPAQKNRKA